MHMGVEHVKDLLIRRHGGGELHCQEVSLSYFPKIHAGWTPFQVTKIIQRNFRPEVGHEGQSGHNVIFVPTLERIVSFS